MKHRVLVWVAPKAVNPALTIAILQIANHAMRIIILLGYKTNIFKFFRIQGHQVAYLATKTVKIVWIIQRMHALHGNSRIIGIFIFSYSGSHIGDIELGSGYCCHESCRTCNGKIF